mmetsp:Transcript_20874/g.43618  ORF Transcript_20874/g.43618 Transcript_20874/m.43618 type:complete len:257 (-) Transcript_20874:443-1213(-)
MITKEFLTRTEQFDFASKDVIASVMVVARSLRGGKHGRVAMIVAAGRRRHFHVERGRKNGFHHHHISTAHSVHGTNSRVLFSLLTDIARSFAATTGGSLLAGWWRSTPSAATCLGHDGRCRRRRSKGGHDGGVVHFSLRLVVGRNGFAHGIAHFIARGQVAQFIPFTTSHLLDKLDRSTVWSILVLGLFHNISQDGRFGGLGFLRQVVGYVALDNFTERDIARTTVVASTSTANHSTGSGSKVVWQSNVFEIFFLR